MIRCEVGFYRKAVEAHLFSLLFNPFLFNLFSQCFFSVFFSVCSVIPDFGLSVRK